MGILEGHEYTTDPRISRYFRARRLLESLEWLPFARVPSWLDTVNTVYLFEALANRGNYAFGWASGPQAFITRHDYGKPLVAFAKRYRALFG
ncbi:MAG: hypothetical protein HY815_23670 [Candidatus Riflebacteria bacterium]|nr:hypothetical protein [Candidatus Riflebacteria bacterium]